MKLELERERNGKAHGKHIVAALVADSLDEDLDAEEPEPSDTAE